MYSAGLEYRLLIYQKPVCLNLMLPLSRLTIIFLINLYFNFTSCADTAIISTDFMLGGELKGMDALRDSVIAAINQYNNFTKNGKLKLERLIQANYFGLNSQLLYTTFYAIDVNSSNSGVYQAATAEYDGQQFLGLFRDFSQDKILAILSLSGVDEDLAVKKKDQGVDKDLAVEKKNHMSKILKWFVRKSGKQ